MLCSSLSSAPARPRATAPASANAVAASTVTRPDVILQGLVPPAAASLDISPECVVPMKPGSVESTPPEAVSTAAAAAAAAAAGDLARKLVPPPRSKLVHDPRSFGYRRLLPFLNEMKNDGSIGKEALPQDTAAHSKDGLSGSDSRLADESVGVGLREPKAMDSVEPVVLNTGGDADVKDACNNVTEEIKTVPHDLSNKPLLARCRRSRFVHHPSSFSYKRMLPFLLENAGINTSSLQTGLSGGGCGQKTLPADARGSKFPLQNPWTKG